MNERILSPSVRILHMQNQRKKAKEKRNKMFIMGKLYCHLMNPIDVLNVQQ